jgi:hypothetical protein
VVGGAQGDHLAAALRFLDSLLLLDGQLALTELEPDTGPRLLPLALEGKAVLACWLVEQRNHVDDPPQCGGSRHAELNVRALVGGAQGVQGRSPTQAEASGGERSLHPATEHAGQAGASLACPLLPKSIFLIQTDGELVEMTEQPYDTEDVLQRLLAKYPNLLAGDQMDPDKPRCS